METLEPILAQHPFFQDIEPGYRVERLDVFWW